MQPGLAPQRSIAAPSPVASDAERRLELAAALRELLAVLNSQRSLVEMLDFVLQRATGLLASDAGAVYVLESERGEPILRVGAVRGLTPDRVAVRLGLDTPVSGLAAKTRRPVAVVDLPGVLARGSDPRAEPAVDDHGSHLVVERIGGPASEPTRLERLRRLAASHPAVLSVPLVTRDQTFGALVLLYSAPRTFSDQDVELVSAFADQAALAIENTQLRDRAEQRARELEALYRADARLHRSLRQGEVLQALVETAAEILAADKTSVLLWDADRQRLRVQAAHGFKPATIPRMAYPPGEGISSRVALSGQPIAVEDVRLDPRISPRIRAINQTERIRSLMSVPIKLADQVVGVFNVNYRRPRSFGDDERRMLLALSERAALAIQNARLYAEGERRTRESERRRAVAEGLSELLAVVNSRRSLDEILDSAMAQAANLLGCEASAVYLVGDQPGFVTLRAARGHAPGELLTTMPVESSVTGAAVQQRRVVVCDVLAAFPPGSARARETQLEDRGAYVRVAQVGGPLLRRHDIVRMRRLARRYRTMLSVPLIARDTTYGAITLFYARPRDFAADDLALAEAFANQAALAIQNARLHAESERRLDELRALYRADGEMYRSLRLDEVLKSLVDVATDILGADKTALMVWDAARQRVVVGAARGFGPPALNEVYTLEESSLTRLLGDAHEGDVATVEDVGRATRVPRRVRALLLREGVRATMHTAIRVGEAVFGTFGIAYSQPRSFGEPERRLLSALAQRAGLAIQNARLYEQAQHAATLDERQRLARELHDAVTQTLFSAALLADVVPAVWDVNPARARQHLDDLRRLTRGALAEMRALLVELRPGALADLSLPDLLRQLGEATMGRARLDVSVAVDGQPARPLDAEVKLALYRIAQEGLNNIARHAHAGRASIELSYGPTGGVGLRLVDDGQGFDPDHIPAGHLGVRIMAERARAIGARLRVDSRPGHGTCLEVGWTPASE